MAQLLQAPTEGYEDAIVVLAIIADNFELKHGLLTLVQNKHQFFPPSKTTNLRNEITNFQQRFDESFSEIWDRFKDLLRACPHHATDGNVYRDNIQELVSQASAVNYNQGNTSYRPLMIASTSSSGTLSSNTIANPKSDLKSITTQSEAIKDTVHPTNNGNTKDVQPQDVQSESLILTSNPVTYPIFEPIIAPASAPNPNPKSLIPYPSRRNDERNPLIRNKEKLSEMARTPLNEHCFAVLLKKLPKNLALADLGPSINLMPFSVWKRLSVPDLTPTCMSLELANRLISHSVRIAEDVYIKTGRALIDVFECELTLRVGKEAITFNLDQTSRYPANYNDMTAKRTDVIDMACEEYSQEVLGFSNVISSSNPTLFYDPIVSTTSPTLTLFENSDFLVEEVDAFLAIEDDPTSLEFYQPYLDPEGDILLLEAFLNDDPSLPPPNQGNYLPEVQKELKICEAKSDKSSVDEPLEVKLKDLPPHLKYAFFPWVSPMHCVPKKGGFTVVENEDNELILTRLVMSWRVCLDYRKLNEATRKDYFPLPFMDQILERLARNQY
nr:reverse transcriptase domain-containing protein [Tanacetum cinerariifolium]